MKTEGIKLEVLSPTYKQFSNLVGKNMLFMQTYVLHPSEFLGVFIRWRGS